MKISVKKTFKQLLKNKLLIIFFVILLLSTFLRFYNLELMTTFGWDQLDNAWASARILVDHNYPLIGMQAKGNSGVFIGPLYYYFVSVFYYLTNLDPIAAGIIAGVTSIFSIIGLYVISKNIFNEKVALISSFIYAVASNSMLFDRVQWPVNFTPLISGLIFYGLFKIINGNSKFILFLSVFLGLSFHIHFTSIFYPIIILLCLPFFPRDRKTLKYTGFGFLILIIFMMPIILNFVLNSNSIMNVSKYGNIYYHGLHLKRVIQLIGDAFIQFDYFLKFDFLKFLKFLLVPLFIIFNILNKPKKQQYSVAYLVSLFFLVPWLVMSTYSGELSDYYFSSTRFLVIFIISSFIYLIYSINNIIPKASVIFLLLIYGYFNINEFINSNTSNSIKSYRERAINAVNENKKVEFVEGDSNSYFYYYYMYKKGKKVY